MTIELLPDLDTRIIDVGPTDFSLGRSLAELGYERYLALVPPVALEAVRRDAGERADRVHALRSPEMVYRNNADLLVIRASQARLLWAWRDIGEGRLVAVERIAGRRGAEARVASALGRRAGKLHARGEMVAGGSQLDLYAIPGTAEEETRRYFSEVWGVEGFADRLRQAGVSHAVLRWFEQLPVIDDGEDLDVLVADEDLERVVEILGREPGTRPVDLYSVSGLPASDYHDSPYYAPELARRILDGSVTHRSGFSVPSPLDHLHSLAYHALYHKGLRSGVPSETLGTCAERPEHDYPTILRDLATTVGEELPSTLEGIDAHLATRGWRPPADSLRRLASNNPWLDARLDGSTSEATSSPTDGADAELAAFLVRERTIDEIGLDTVLAELDHLGFEVVCTHELDDEAKRRATEQIRGGNWGPGPFAVSGGRPAVVIVTLHHAPDPVSPWLRSRYPHLTNMDIYLAKQRLREVVEERVGSDAAFNPIHSSDNEIEAWEYLGVTSPDLLAEIRAEVRDRCESQVVPGEVLEQLSRGRRAKVEVVRGPDGPVVRKTFVGGYSRHLEREVRFMAELNGVIDAVPPVLESGQTWFTMPYYRDDLRRGGTEKELVPLPILRQMVHVLRQLHGLGYDLVDAKPHNFVLDPAHGLKVVDFEFVHRYADGEQPPFEQSYNFVGVPSDFRGDVPVGDQSYAALWYPFTGMPLDVLVEGSLWAQRRARARHRARELTVAPGSPVRAPVAAIRRGVRGSKARASQAFRHLTFRRSRGLPLVERPTNSWLEWPGRRRVEERAA